MILYIYTYTYIRVYCIRVYYMHRLSIVTERSPHRLSHLPRDAQGRTIRWCTSLELNAEKGTYGRAYFRAMNMSRNMEDYIYDDVMIYDTDIELQIVLYTGDIIIYIYIYVYVYTHC